MIKEYATAEDFTRWEQHAKECSFSSLEYIVLDCFRAADAMRDGNPIREGYYQDQGNTYFNEIRRRQMR
jgi:hypothetical protein